MVEHLIRRPGDQIQDSSPPTICFPPVAGENGYVVHAWNSFEFDGVRSREIPVLISAERRDKIVLAGQGRWFIREFGGVDLEHRARTIV